MKSCESCQADRVHIGKHYKEVPFIRRRLGMALVYLPIITLPFLFISAYLSYYHLKMMGAENLKTLSDYIPDRATHRYTLKSQILMEGSFWEVSRSKIFWMLNCTWYCPVSVGLCEWHTYLVKLIENWWCPFGHEKKSTYDVASIDKSFWHINPVDTEKLHEDDAVNPIWNEDTAQPAKSDKE